MTKQTSTVGCPYGVRLGLSRRSFVNASGGLGLILATEVAPAVIRTAGASTPRKVS